MIECRAVDTINALRRNAWNALFPGEIERFEYPQSIDVMNSVLALHADTRASAAMQFQELTAEYFHNVGYCIANGLKRYQSGQAGYDNKLRLGSGPQGSSMYFRHCNVLVNGVLRAAAPLFAGSLGAQPSA